MTCLHCQGEVPLAGPDQVPERCPYCSGSLPAPPPDDALAAALEAYDAAVERDEAPELDAFCAAHAELGERLRPVLEMSNALAALAPAGRERPKGARLGPYLLGEEIGRGAMAVVFRARDLRMEREIALKVLLPDPGALSGRRRRFLREAVALARLSHPNVVQIHDIGGRGEWLWIAMERMEGSVAARALPPPLDAEALRGVVRVVLEAAEALGHAHAKGVLHRDVKPSNLLVDGEGHVRVADFGIAAVEGSASLTRTGEGVGTPVYAAPEQFGAGAVDERSDVYGLGATLYELLAGEAPPSALVRSSVPLALPPRLPAPLRAITAKAMALEAAARYPSMRDLAADLRAWLAGRPVAARRAPRRLRRLAAAALVVAAAVGLGPGLSPAARLPSAYVVARAPKGGGEPSEWQERWRMVDSPQGADRLGFAARGHEYEARIEHGLLGSSIQLLRNDVPIARYALSTASYRNRRLWRFQRRPGAEDEDGLPELMIEDAQEYAILKWEPQAWRGPAQGWRRRIDGRFGYGSPALADWDGDGRLDLLLGDKGRPGGEEGHSSMLYVLDPASGAQRAIYRMRGSVLSTPRFLRGTDGTLIATYIDTTPATAAEAAYLWRFPSETGGRVGKRSFASRWGLSWPVFSDVDGDGRTEVIVAARGDYEPGSRTAAVHCLRADLRGAPLWTYVPEGAMPSNLLLSDQDGDAADEVCFAAVGSFTCIRTGTGLAERERVVWSAALRAGERVEHQPIEVGDLTGDGIADIAAGTSDGRIVVLSRQSSPALLESVEQPRYASGRSEGSFVDPVDITARLALVPSPDGEASVVAVAQDGFVFSTRLSPGRARCEWFTELRGSAVASPVILKGRSSSGASIDRVLVAWGGMITLLEPPLSDPSHETAQGVALRLEARRHWSFHAEGLIQSTPVVLEREGRTWLYFTDTLGYVYGVPVVLGDTPAASDGPRRDPARAW